MKVSLPNKLTVACTFVIAVATALYVVFAAGQWHEISVSNDISRKVFDAANRPYVGLDGTTPVYISRDQKGQNMPLDHATPEAFDMAFRAAIKNFGSAPALNCDVTWRVFLDAKEASVAKPTGTPSTMFPTQTVFLSGRVGSDNYKAIMNGEKILETEVTSHYEWPGGHQTECQRSQYDPKVNGFANLGDCLKR